MDKVTEWLEELNTRRTLPTLAQMPEEFKTCEEYVLHELAAERHLRKETQRQMKEIQDRTYRTAGDFLVRFGGPIETVESEVVSSWNIKECLTQEQAREMASTHEGLEKAAEMSFGFHTLGVEITHREWPFTLLVDNLVYAADVDREGNMSLNLVQPGDRDLRNYALYPVTCESKLREHAIDFLREMLLNYADEVQG